MIGIPEAKADAWKLRAALCAPLLCVLCFLPRHLSPGYAALCAVCLIFAAVLFWKWHDWKTAWPGIIALIVFGAGLPVSGLWQYWQLRDPGDVEHAVAGNRLWALAHGSGFSSLTLRHAFAAHAEYTQALWIPVQWLGGGAGLKLGQMLCLLLAVSLALRRHLEQRDIAPWTAVALLLCPAVASQFFFGFHPEILAAPFLVLAMQAYRDGKWKTFLACAAFLAWTHEEFSLAVTGMLLLALAEKRPPVKWVLIPLALTLAQMALYWFVIAAHFNSGADPFRSLPDMEPVFASPFDLETLRYLACAALPFSPLLFFFPPRYLLVPLPLLLACAVIPSTHEFWRQYAFPIAFLFAAGLILEGPFATGRRLRAKWTESLRRKGGAEAMRKGRSEAVRSAAGVKGPGPGAEPDRRWIDGRVFLSFAVTSLLCYPLWSRVHLSPPPDWIKVGDLRAIRSLVPEDASVDVNGSFLARFAPRKDVAAWSDTTRPFADFDYLVLDRSFMPGGLDVEDKLGKDIKALSSSQEWTTLFEMDGMFLFRRNKPGKGP